MISFIKVSPGKGGRFIHLPTGLSQYGFEMLNYGSRLFDSVTDTNATCSINGIRYGIVNGAVTQFAVNQPPVEDKGLRGCPAFTQLAKYTEDLTNAAWGKKKVLNPVLITTFQGQSFWQITETTENGNHFVLQTAPWVGATDNALIGLSFIYKSNGRALQIALRSKDGSSYPTVCIVGTNGIISSKNASAFAVSESLGDGLYRITAAIPCGAGSSNPYIYWHMWNGTTSSYTGDGVSGVYLGQPTYINFGVNGIPFIPPYVPNNSGSSVSVVSEAATATTGTSFDLDLPALSAFKKGTRGPLAQGHIELEFESNVDSGWLANNTNLNIFSVSNSNLPLYYRKNIDGTVTNWNLYDGTNATSIVQSLSVGQIYRIVLDYGTYTGGTQKMRLTANGVKSSVVDFSGSFGTQDLKFFFGNTVHFGWIKDLKYYDRPRW